MVRIKPGRRSLSRKVGRLTSRDIRDVEGNVIRRSNDPLTIENMTRQERIKIDKQLSRIIKHPNDLLDAYFSPIVQVPLRVVSRTLDRFYSMVFKIFDLLVRTIAVSESGYVIDEKYDGFSEESLIEDMYFFFGDVVAHGERTDYNKLYKHVPLRRTVGNDIDDVLEGVVVRTGRGVKAVGKGIYKGTVGAVKNVGKALPIMTGVYLGTKNGVAKGIEKYEERKEKRKQQKAANRKKEQEKKKKQTVHDIKIQNKEVIEELKGLEDEDINEIDVEEEEAKAESVLKYYPYAVAFGEVSMIKDFFYTFSIGLLRTIGRNKRIILLYALISFALPILGFIGLIMHISTEEVLHYQKDIPDDYEEVYKHLLKNKDKIIKKNTEVYKKIKYLIAESSSSLSKKQREKLEMYADALNPKSNTEKLGSLKDKRDSDTEYEEHSFSKDLKSKNHSIYNLYRDKENRLERQRDQEAVDGIGEASNLVNRINKITDEKMITIQGNKDIYNMSMRLINTVKTDVNAIGFGQYNGANYAVVDTKDGDIIFNLDSTYKNIPTNINYKIKKDEKIIKLSTISSDIVAQVLSEKSSNLNKDIEVEEARNIANTTQDPNVKDQAIKTIEENVLKQVQPPTKKVKQGEDTNDKDKE